MTYAVKEIFYTLQGEGAQVGRAAVFCRMAGCNLWSGREIDRAQAICQFCDTDFVGMDGTNGGRFAHAEALANKVDEQWAGEAGRKLVVVTGGEPLLQLDAELVAALHGRSFEIAIETNGTLEAPDEVDWICVSPKAGTQLRLTRGNELKFVYPQFDIDPATLADLEFDHFWLQPMDGARLDENTRLAIEYCLSHPQWRLSVQTHKVTGIR